LGLDADTHLEPAGDGTFAGAIADGWATPRGPLGGYVMALVLRGMLLAVDDPGRQPRSLTMHFLRPPQVGPITVRPVVERAGRSLTTATARLEQEGRLLGLALGAFSTPWEGPLLADAPMPRVEPPAGRDVPVPELPGGGYP
jgi:acyl-CoA thioesterase